jgi:hypothetical protein
VYHLQDIHNYIRQHQKLASDHMKTRYDRLANCAAHRIVSLSAHRPERKAIQASIPMGEPIEGINADKGCGVQDPAEP